MTAIVLPDIDLDELKRNIPSMAEIDLPSLAKAGQHADEAIDRWRGRSRGPSWPWIAAGIFAVGLIGTLVALVTWSRRSPLIDDIQVEPMGRTEPYGTTESYTGSESYTDVEPAYGGSGTTTEANPA